MYRLRKICGCGRHSHRKLVGTIFSVTPYYSVLHKIFKKSINVVSKKIHFTSKKKYLFHTRILNLN